MNTKDIITERLVLKSMTLKDVEIAWELWGKEETAKYLVDPYYKDVEELRKLIVDIETWENEYPFIAYKKDTLEVVGTCSIGQEGRIGQWGPGYFLKKEMWGKGYGTEILKALIEFAYSLGIHDFQGSVANENIASKRVMEKCGMKLDSESSFKKGGTNIIYPSSIYKLHLD